MKRVIILGALLVAGLVSGCSQKGAQTVQAAPSGYSSASLDGTYVFVDRSSGAIGTFVFDGSGNYTGGSQAAGQEIFGCLPSSFSGTYTINSHGSGSGTFSCQGISNQNVTIMATQSGNSFVIGGATNAQTLAVKQ